MDSAANFENLFAHAATGFAVTGCDGQVLHANKALARMIRRAPREIGEINLFDLTHPDDQSQHQRLLNQLLTSQIPGYVIEKRYLRPDGTSVWVRNSVSVANHQGQRTGHLVHICEDISDRKRAEQILQDQEQMAAIGRLTSSIAHEINNPLEAVFNLIYLARSAADFKEADPYLQLAEEELTRVCEITTHGLRFHRQSSLLAPANVVEILKTVLVLFRGRLRGSRVGVQLDFEETPALLCFAGELRQVFVNLISNAIESMPRGGQLLLRVRPATDWRTHAQGVRITIADRGDGMSPETQARMYEAFYTTKGTAGSGLGLWVTANILRKHDGSIRVRSKKTGTVFSLFLPYRGAEGKSAGFQDAA